jgi:tetratricopeptide (TPR) repeat protein
MKHWLAFLVLTSVGVIAPGHACASGNSDELDVRAERGWSREVIAEINKGGVLTDQKRFEEARRMLDDAVRRNPTAWAAYFNRARVFNKQHKWELAIQDFSMVLRLKPTMQHAALGRLRATLKLGKYGPALTEFDEILASHPNSEVTAEILNSRAWLLATCQNPSFRNGKQAVVDAKRACDLTHWNDPDLVDTLAAAYAEVGDFEAAVRYQEKAISLSHGHDIESDPRSRLRMYQRHQPFRESLT